MTTTDITGTVSSGVTLTSAVYSDPVTIDSGALITASSTAIYSKYDWTIDNAGAIESSYIGIKLHSTATIINESTGTISGLNNAIKAPYGGVTLTNHGLIENLNTGGGSNAVYLQHTGVVLNTGTITATYRDGLIVSQGGSVTNAAGALIHGGSDGIKDDDNGSFTLDNAGTITATRDKGLNIQGDNKTVLNEAGGVIHGHTYGIIVNSDSTIENAGTIIGDQIGIKMASGDLLKVDAGAVFSGVVEGNGSTMELTSSASGGAIRGFGSEYTGFGSVTIDNGASWDIGGTTSHLESTTFHNFHAGDRLDFTDLSFVAGDTATYSAGHLTIYDAGHMSIASVSMTGSFGGHSFNVLSDGGSGSYVEEDGVACYCRGTEILTDRGQVAVEHLKIGDMLVTAGGASRPIRWIGRRSYAGRFAAANKTVQPIRIAAGALAHNTPRRDLFVSAAACHVPGRDADPGAGADQRRIDHPGRERRTDRVFPYRTGKP